MEILQGVWKQHLRPRAVVGCGVKIILPSLQVTSPDHLEFFAKSLTIIVVHKKMSAVLE